jgi:hypothetical protein
MQYKSRARLEERPVFRNFSHFAEAKPMKILAKWWDLPPTVGQII